MMVTKSSGQKVANLSIALFLILNLIGCEAFVRKFTRKPKEADRQEEMVIAPQEYKNTLSHEEQYRQYFTFWKAWQDELLTAMDVTIEQTNNKKQIDCANEALKNLMSMKPLLNSGAQKKLDPYLSRSIDLRDALERDYYGLNVSLNRQEARRLRKDILQNFSFPDIKKDLL